MDRNEAVQILSEKAKISVSYAEDLYDSFFPRPVVPQCVADWIKKCKMFKSFAVSLSFALQPSVWEANSLSGECIEWLMDAENQETYARAWLDGYEVEKEPKYTVKLKGFDDDDTFLNYNPSWNIWFLGDDDEVKMARTAHTRKELEENGFGWVFDCPGVEVKEVTDE